MIQVDNRNPLLLTTLGPTTQESLIRKIPMKRPIGPLPMAGILPILFRTRLGRHSMADDLIGSDHAITCLQPITGYDKWQVTYNDVA
jgi:hypothetical protein